MEKLISSLLGFEVKRVEEDRKCKLVSTRLTTDDFVIENTDVEGLYFVMCYNNEYDFVTYWKTV